MTFDSLTERIAAGEVVSQSELLPYLCCESSEERGLVNYRFAKAFTQAGNYRYAKVFIERAWLLSKFSGDVLDLYKQICEKNDDIVALRDAYKRRGMHFSRDGRIEEALTSFNQWQYAFAMHYHLDRYAYDIDILECIENLAKPFKFDTSQLLNRPDGHKLRLAYLVYGAAQANSVLVKINLMFAKHHDKDAFEVAFFIPESKPIMRRNCKELEKNEQLFKSCGVTVYFTPLLCKENRLVSCAQQIYKFRPDILITSAALAEFEHYFIASLRPAPIVIGLLQGPPQQFIAPGLDHAISWSRHPLIDSPINTSFVKLGVELPDPVLVPRISRETFDIPDDSVVLMSAGRYVKFQNMDFWRHLILLMKSYPGTYFVAVGVDRDQILCLKELDISQVDDRMRFLGWRTDCVSILTIADVLIDTFPSGGGHVLIDAMSMGVPFVSFENNYLQPFDQSDWSVADEFVDIPELIVPRGDFEKFSDVIGKLISNREYRHEMSVRCAQQIRSSLPTPEDGVRALEKEYLRLAGLSLRKIPQQASPCSSQQWQRMQGLRNLLAKLVEFAFKSTASTIKK